MCLCLHALSTLLGFTAEVYVLPSGILIAEGHSIQDVPNAPHFGTRTADKIV
jgi:hypothetical protein